MCASAANANPRKSSDDAHAYLQAERGGIESRGATEFDKWTLGPPFFPFFLLNIFGGLGFSFLQMYFTQIGRKNAGDDLGTFRWQLDEDLTSGKIGTWYRLS